MEASDILASRESDAQESVALMGFQKGQPRPPNAGRKKGSKNKKKVARVADYLAERDINPAKEILALIHGKDEEDKDLLTPFAKMQAWFDLLAYCQAKPKEIDPSAEESDDDSDLLDQFEQVTDATLLKIVKDEDGVM